MKFWYWLTIVMLTLCCGCGEDTQIRTYTVARKIAPASPASESKPAQTLGVIVPNRDSAWFLKLMDDPSKVAPLTEEFRQLAGSLGFDEQGKPYWKLAPGWTEQILDSITYAKFSHEGGATATLTKLSANTSVGSDWQNHLLDNINRWRDQLGLPKLDWQAMQPDLEEVPQLSIGTAKAYFVSLEGTRKGSGMGSGAPFLDRMRAQQAQSQSEPSSSPATGPQATAARPQLKYQVPAGWNEVVSSSGIRLATFEISAPGGSATVTISMASGELESTIQMWLEQVGVEPDPQRVQQVVESATSGSVRNQEYKCYRLQGKGDSAATIRVAVIAMENNQNMFVKMTGPAGLIDAQASAMDQLVSSLQW